jgi:hypothetical protein
VHKGSTEVFVEDLSQEANIIEIKKQINRLAEQTFKKYLKIKKLAFCTLNNRHFYSQIL